MLNMHNIMNHNESIFQYFRVDQFRFNIEEVIHKLTDISDCISKGYDPITYLDMLGVFDFLGIGEKGRYFEDKSFVFWVVEDCESLVIVLYVPIQL